jgi:hypothetical protein
MIYFGLFMAYLEELKIENQSKDKQCPKKSQPRERIVLKLETLGLNDYNRILD